MDHRIYNAVTTIENLMGYDSGYIYNAVIAGKIDCIELHFTNVKDAEGISTEVSTEIVVKGKE